MNLWKRRERVAWICGVEDRISQDPVFVQPPVSLGGNYPCKLKGWALRSETLGAENMAWLWLSLALVLVVLSSSKTQGGPWRNLTIIVRRVERASSHNPRGPVLIRDKYQQEPVGTAFAFLCEDRSFIGHLLFFGLPIVSEILGSLNTGRLKTNWNVRRRNPCRGDTHSEGQRGVSRDENEGGNFK